MSRLAAAIDFGTSKIAIAAGRLDERGTLTVAGAGQAMYAGFRDDEWLDLVGLEDAILTAKRAAEVQAGRKIRDMYVSVPGDFIQAVFQRVEVPVASRDGVITREDVDQLIEEAAAYAPPSGYLPLHRTPVAYVVDGQSRQRPPVGEKSSGYLGAFVSIVYALETFVDHVGAILGNLGIGVMGFIAGPLGTGYIARCDGETKRTAVVLDVGHYSMDIIVAEGEGLVYHSNMPLGGGTVTKDISVLMNMPLDDAERTKRLLTLGLKRGEVISERQSAARAGLSEAQEIAEARVWDICRRVVAALNDLGVTYDGQTGVYLTGGGLALLKGSKDILGATMGRIVKIYSHQSPFLNSPTYTAAVGSLYYALNVLARGNTFRDIIGRLRDLF